MVRLPPPLLPERGWRWHQVAQDGERRGTRRRCAPEGRLTRHRARRREAGWRVVGLVGGQDRGRVAARRRRRGVHRAPRVEARLRPARARSAAAGAGRRPRRRGVPAPAGGAGRAVALGVATVGDLADYHRLKRDQVRAVVDGDRSLARSRSTAGARPRGPHPGALAALATRGRHRTTLLSPFDSLVWDRARTLRVFGFHAPSRGVRAGAQARAWLLRHAAIGRRAPARARRSRGATGHHVGAPSASSCEPGPRSTTWPRRCGRPRNGSAATPSRSRRSIPPALAAPLRAALA